MFDNVNKCSVKIANSEYCKKYTKFKYCFEHYEFYKKECEKYHFLKTSLVEDEALLSLVEYYQRQNFRYKYNLIPDDGHSK